MSLLHGSGTSYVFENPGTNLSDETFRLIKSEFNKHIEYKSNFLRKGRKMKAQRMSIITVFTIVWSLLTTNAQAGLIPMDITKTTVMQGLYANSQRDPPFSADEFFGNLFMPEVSTIENIGLLEPSLDGSDVYSIQANQIGSWVAATPYYVAFADLTWVEDLPASGQSVSELQLSSYPSRGREMDPDCPPTYVHLAIPSSLNCTYIEELDELNELPTSDCWYHYDFWHHYDSWYPYDSWNRIAHFDGTGATISPEGNISSVAIPEPATILSLGFGTLVFMGKRR